MLKKWDLILGLFLLTIGIVLKIFTDYIVLSIFFIAGGVIQKVKYILIKYRDGEYKPGIELLLLVLGLSIFFTGIYLRSIENPSSIILMVLGIFLKASFIFLFIKKTRG